MVPPLALWKKSLRHSFFHALCCGLFFNQLEGAHTVLLILSPWQRWWGLPRRSQWCRCSLSSPPSSSATSATSSPSAPSWLLSPASSSSFQVLVFTNTTAGLISAAQWVQHCVRRASFLVLFLARAAGVWTGRGEGVSARSHWLFMIFIIKPIITYGSVSKWQKLFSRKTNFKRECCLKLIWFVVSLNETNLRQTSSLHSLVCKRQGNITSQHKMFWLTVYRLEGHFLHTHFTLIWDARIHVKVYISFKTSRVKVRWIFPLWFKLFSSLSF